MIERYSNPEMQTLWSEEAKFDSWMKVELFACEAWGTLGKIPPEEVETLKKNFSLLKPDIPRIKEIEEETKHDVIAFTRSLSEQLGEERRWVHYGLTSTDVVDTALGYRLRLVNEKIEEKLVAFQNVLKEQALRFQEIPCIGRTHGIHADITSFGLKFLLWYEEMERNLSRFRSVRKEIEVGKLSGAVGNFANTPPFVQDFVCQKLEIESAKISTQVIQRDRHAHYLSVIALIGSSMEKIAVEIRHLQRTEVAEVQESFGSGQKGSSAMPHKKNPISSENICGCSRVLRGYMVAGFENIPLWHERDISHSSSERIVLADATILIHYMLDRYTKTLKNLVVHKERMARNIELTNGAIYAQQVLSFLIERGMDREGAYDALQKAAALAWEKTPDPSYHLKELLRQQKFASQKIEKEELDSVFSQEPFMRRVGEIYDRVLGGSPSTQ